MYGDTGVMRRRAGQLREQGEDIRAAADRLVVRSESVPWQGRAADAMRERVKERAAHLRAAARAHDTAAESLERHLAEVDRLKEAVAEAERRVRGDVEDAQHRVSAYDAPDTDHRDATTALPPPGHADWLALEPSRS
jgi:chromosome segregation ATPase